MQRNWSCCDLSSAYPGRGDGANLGNEDRMRASGAVRSMRVVVEPDKLGWCPISCIPSINMTSKSGSAGVAMG